MFTLSVAAATDTQHTGSWLDLPGRSLVVMCGKFFLHVLCNSFAEPSKVQMECTQATWNQNQSDLYKNMCQISINLNFFTCFVLNNVHVILQTPTICVCVCVWVSYKTTSWPKYLNQVVVESNFFYIFVYDGVTV